MIDKKQEEQVLKENIRFFQEQFCEEKVRFSLPDSLRGERLVGLLEENPSLPLAQRQKKDWKEWLFPSSRQARHLAFACTLVFVLGLSVTFVRYGLVLPKESDARIIAQEAVPEAAAYSAEAAVEPAAGDSAPDTAAAPQLQAAPRLVGGQGALAPAKPNPCGNGQCSLPEDAVLSGSKKEIREILSHTLALLPQEKAAITAEGLDAELPVEVNGALQEGMIYQVGAAEISYEAAANRLHLSAQGRESTLSLEEGAQVLAGSNSLCVMLERPGEVMITLYQVDEEGKLTKAASHSQAGEYFDLMLREGDQYSLLTTLPVTEKMLQEEQFLPSFDQAELALDQIQLQCFPDYRQQPEYAISSTITPETASAFATLYAAEK